MNKGQKCYGYVNGKQYQVALYPMDYISITQSPWGSTSHRCTTAPSGNSGCWDVVGNGGKQPIYAPFDCHRVAYASTVSNVYNGNQCILQSDNEVIMANGNVGYAYFGFGHDGRYGNCPTSNNCDTRPQTEYPIVANTTTFKQGELVGYTGCAGYTCGMHSHWILGKGTWSGWSYCKDSGNTGFISGNPIDIDDLFYANGTQITASGQTTTGGGATCTWQLFDCGGEPPTPTEKWTVTLNVSPDGAGYCTGGGEYEDGEEATLEAFANKGYEFEKWSDGYTNPLRYWTITNDLTLTAIFKKKDNLKGTLQDIFIIEALKVLHGDYGNGVTRKKKLGNDYKTVQSIVNYLLAHYNIYDRLAMMCWIGLYGNGVTRKKKLKQAGYNYNLVQLYVKKYNKTKNVVKY